MPREASGRSPFAPLLVKMASATTVAMATSTICSVPFETPSAVGQNCHPLELTDPQTIPTLSERGVGTRCAARVPGTMDKRGSIRSWIVDNFAAHDGAEESLQEPTDALSALVYGRWSIVERFEYRGRKYLVGRANEVPHALTERELQVAVLVAAGQSNKLVGYTIGIAPTTVASHLSAVQRKTGLRTRLELVEVVRRLGSVTVAKREGPGDPVGILRVGAAVDARRAAGSGGGQRGGDS